MATYSLHTIAPPTISLQFHTFRFRVSRETPGTDAPFWKAVGEITFQKPAHESWANARSRFFLTVSAWLATYEKAQDINTAISQWLQTQTWET